MPSRKLAIAEHLLHRSYPALKDPKILLSVLQNVLGAIEDGITEKLEEARENGEIPPYGETLNGKITAFRMHLAKKYDVNPVDFMLISELQELLAKHDDSPTSFRRKDRFVIADEDYNLSELSEEKTKTYIRRAKSFLSQL